jgi:transposase
VPTKTREQQSCLMLHRTRRLFIRQQTAIINSIRAHLPSSGNRRDVNGWKGRTARNAERSIRRSGQPT